MLGLVKKDFFIIKANLKSMIIIFLVYCIMTLQGTFTSTFIMPVIGIMLFISTFSYDDFNNWNAYVSTIPNGRKNAVKAKYIASVIIMILLAVASLFIEGVINLINTSNIEIEMMLSTLLVTLMSTTIIISLLYPIMFKYGSTNGRIILFAVVFGITGLVAIISNVIDLSFIKTDAFTFAINIIEKYAYLVIPMFLCIILIVSYFISKKIYQNKEF